MYFQLPHLSQLPPLPTYLSTYLYTYLSAHLRIYLSLSYTVFPPTLSVMYFQLPHLFQLPPLPPYIPAPSSAYLPTFLSLLHYFSFPLSLISLLSQYVMYFPLSLVHSSFAPLPTSLPTSLPVHLPASHTLFSLPLSLISPPNLSVMYRLASSSLLFTSCSICLPTYLSVCMSVYLPLIHYFLILSPLFLLQTCPSCTL